MPAKKRRFGAFFTGAMLCISTVPANADEPGESFGLLWSAQINEGVNLDEVQAFLNELLTDVERNDATLVYEIVRVGETFYGYERYESAEAFLRHLNVLGPFVEQMQAAWTVETMVATSPPPTQLSDMLRNFGVSVPDYFVGAGD